MAICSIAHAETILIDLNEFWADATVSIATDGSSAIMEEDSLLSDVFLSNDPAFGDPGISIPAGLLTISFDYIFSEGSNNDDYFSAKVFDGDSGSLIYDFSVMSSDAGSIIWDLSTLDSTITLLGLEFQLSADDSLTDTVVSISNVLMTTQDAAVPEPSTILLFSAGLIAYAGSIRRRSFL